MLPNQLFACDSVTASGQPASIQPVPGDWDESQNPAWGQQKSEDNSGAVTLLHARPKPAKPRDSQRSQQQHKYIPG